MRTPVISFYSDVDGSTYYTDCAQSLKDDCRRFGIRHYIRKLPSSKDWRINCLKKAQFILDMLLEKREPLIWMDCDSVILQRIDDLDAIRERGDFASPHASVGGINPIPNNRDMDCALKS